MKKTIFRNINVLIVTALLICSVVSTYIFSRLTFNNNVNNMLYSLQLVDYSIDYSQNLREQIDLVNEKTLGDDSRMTVITLDGKVIADSAVDDLQENHLDRKEVKDAINEGVGKEVRYSNTIHKNMLYVAYLSEHDVIIRLSVPYSGMKDYLAMAVPGVGTSIIISLGLSVLFSRYIAKKVSEPLEEISQQLLLIEENDPVFKKQTYEYTELNDIVSVTDRLAKKINRTIASLKREKNKVHYILDNMQEGMIVIDEDNTVILINHAANAMFNCEDVEKGLPIESYIQESKILKRIKSHNVYETFHLGDKYFSIHKAKIDSGVFKNSTIVLFLDVTPEEMAMKMKQIFFSNASHELKTPLTSIQGYAELLNQHLIHDENQKDEFVHRILKETKNMTRLINDILAISKLENHQTLPDVQLLHLNLIIEDIFHTLSPMANDRGIHMICNSENVDFYGDLEQMNQLLTNLLSNSIKYGRDNGWVSVKFNLEEDFLKIIVEDNGMGIPKEDIPHVTERFYRVDKGRTKAIEGTGLGLAIVKHIVQLYEGDLKIESVLGIGTKTTIYLKNMKKDVL